MQCFLYFIIFLLHKQLTELPIFPRGFRVFCYGNTTQSLCVRCVVRFFGNMTENLHADCVQSRQAGFVRCCPTTAALPQLMTNASP